jgi:hypothetical protein
VARSARTRLDRLRHGLLELHRALADAERIELERGEGRLSNGAFLRRLLEDPALAWLLELSGLIVRIDELLDAEDDGDGDVLLAELERMLTPSVDGGPFQRRYAARMQDTPAVVVAHGAVMLELRVGR